MNNDKKFNYCSWITLIVKVKDTIFQTVPLLLPTMKAALQANIEENHMQKGLLDYPLTTHQHPKASVHLQNLKLVLTVL